MRDADLYHGKSAPTDRRVEDALIALAWLLSLGNSIIVHLCKFSLSGTVSDLVTDENADCLATYTGYRNEDVPSYAIDWVHAGKVCVHLTGQNHNSDAIIYSFDTL